MRTRQFLHLFFAGFFPIVLCLSCEDEPDFIGVGILPAGDAFRISFDSIGEIRGYTFYGDSIFGNFKRRHLLGSQVDPFFGFSGAEIIGQFQPTSSSRSFGNNPVCDSVILNLYPEETTGIISSPAWIRVFEYTEPIDQDSGYYTNMDIQGKYREEEIGTAMFSENTSVIRVRITDEVFINKFLTAPDSVLQDSRDLQDYVNGLYMTTEEAVSDGVFITLDLTSEENELIFYYSNDSTASTQQIYTFGESSMGINLFQHNFSGYPIETYLDNGSKNDSLLFIQSMSGASSMIRLEGITGWADSMPVAIISARLILPVADSSVTRQKSIYRPPQLDLYLVDSTYSQNFDEQMLDQSSGGYYDESTNSYIFNLKVQIQSILHGNVENLEMILKVTGGSSNVYRTVLRGKSTDPGQRMRLEITYTVF